jgi:hypothetical protein
VSAFEEPAHRWGEVIETVTDLLDEEDLRGEVGHVRVVMSEWY